MKKYVQVGCGYRGVYSFTLPMVENYGDCAKLCAVYDINKKRAELAKEYTKQDILVYEDFDKMLAEVKPDIVLVTCNDSVHDTYIIKALEAGCDVISEKPLTTTPEKANAIREAEEKSGKKVTVTFNLRFHPFFIRLKEMISSGIIGDVLSVHFEWLLDTSHGADYFRRWHRRREFSGSLLVHKSTHHFDIVNWLLEEDPVSVNAFGTRRFYGPTREKRSERCLTCPYKRECKFYLDLEANEALKRMYLDCEDADGYFRDRCVFADEINIEDSIAVNVKYSGGAVMSYSLTAHSPYEGVRMMLNGTEGRLEAYHYAENQVGFCEEAVEYATLYNRYGEKIDYHFPKGKEEGHGGADDNMRDKLFYGIGDDPLGQMADLHAGLMSIGIGMAATCSMDEGRQISIQELYEQK